MSFQSFRFRSARSYSLFLSCQTSGKRQHHLNKHLYRPSTFLTSYEPPVYMEDEDERSSFFSSLQDGTAQDSVSRFKPHTATALHYGGPEC